MIPGFDIQPVFTKLVHRFATMARTVSDPAERRSLAITVRKLTHAQAAAGGGPSKRAPATARPAEPGPQSRRDPYEEERLRVNRQLAALFRLALERDQVDWTSARLQDDWDPETIAIALRSMPEARSQRRGGLAQRIAERDALASAPPASSSPSATVAATIRAAYDKALGRQS